MEPSKNRSKKQLEDFKDLYLFSKSNFNRNTIDRHKSSRMSNPRGASKKYEQKLNFDNYDVFSSGVDLNNMSWSVANSD